MSFEVTVNAAFAKNALGALHQQPPEFTVATLSDTASRVTAPGLPLPGYKPQISCHVTTAIEPVGILNTQYKCQGSNFSYAIHLHQDARDRVLIAAEITNYQIKSMNLPSETLNDFQLALQCRHELRWHKIGRASCRERGEMWMAARPRQG